MTTNTITLSPSQELIDMIKRVEYKKGWAFEHLPPNMFRIMIKCEDSTGVHEKVRQVADTRFIMDWRDDTQFISFRDVERPFVVVHTFIMPPEAVMFDEASCRRWLLDRIVDVETHEACEFFALESKTDKGAFYKPFFPHTGDWQTEQPYRIINRTPE